MTSWLGSGVPRRATWIGIAIVVGLGVWAVTHPKRDSAAATIPTEPVQKRDIVVTVDATGTVEPIDLVEVKSKASGQIVRMPVEVGSVIRKGALLAQVDPTDVRNQYAQARAALIAAQAKADVSSAQKKRAEQLFEAGVITAPEHESAVLDYANAQSALVSARTNLDLARQRLDDATVSAPIDGTVLSQTVAVGQVISSATSSVSGGTTLLTMADLRRIRVRVQVSETDIGNVRPGQEASVQIDAFPQHNFQGQVEKIEPQAVVDQSVTVFPVLVSLENPNGQLLPGMNGEVTIMVAERSGVLAVPMDALRSLREIPAIATALGLDPDSVRAQLGEQRRARMATAGDSTQARGVAAGGSGAGSWRGGRGGGSDSARGRRFAGRGPRSGADAGGATAGAGAGGATGGFSGSGGGRSGGGQMVFVKTEKGYEPRLVRIGVSNFDYAQVLDGVREGEQVALVSVAEIQAQRTQDMQRIRQRVGGGVPGVGGGTGGGGGGGRRGGS